jgi:hypothetical protein
MLGYRFSATPSRKPKHYVSLQLVLITAGNVAEALQWLTEDRQYGLTNDKYGSRIYRGSEEEGYITEEGQR